jgi:DNA-binding NtrC family response regulator
LRNVVERLMLLATGEVVDAATVRLALPKASNGGHNGAVSNGASGALSERVAQYERQTILTELQQNQYHITNTAKALGLERSHLYKKCQQLGIDLRSARGN